MRILITGVNGFVGSHLAKRLRHAGDQVWGLSADHAAGQDDTRASQIARIDILELSSLSDFVATCDPEVIVHLAGLSHVGASWKQPGAYYRVNFVGTANVLRAAAGRRVIFASSSEVYGEVDEADQPLREDRELDPRSPYAMTKACAEAIAIDHGATVIRSFNAIGPGQATSFAFPSFALQLKKIAAGQAPPALSVGNLEPRRDFVHIDDVVSGYTTAIRSSARGQVYNLASGRATRIGALVEKLVEISKTNAETVVDPQRTRSIDIPLLCGDASRLRSLGWNPRHSVDDALGQLWEEIAAGDSSS